MFPSYVENPPNCHFEGQDSDEQILLLLRAHPITNLPWIILSLLVFSLPFVVPPLSPLVGFNFSALPPTYQIILTIIDYLVVLLIVFEGFLYWYFNVNIISSKRIIDIDFSSVILKNIDLAPLRNVEEADSAEGGLFGTIFNFGHVSIQTAGAQVAILMKNVPSPAVVADFILDLADKQKKGG